MTPIILMATIMDSLGGITNLTIALNVSTSQNVDSLTILNSINSFALNPDKEVSQLCIFVYSLMREETAEFLDIDLTIIDRLNFHFNSNPSLLWKEQIV